jgi:hypothetical protein
MSTHDKDTNDLESPLGIAQEPIVQKPEDHLIPGDPSTRRSRARALGEDGIEKHTDGLGDLNVDPDGAAGIDMGSGGEGTDILPPGRSRGR